MRRCGAAALRRVLPMDAARRSTLSEQREEAERVDREASEHIDPATLAALLPDVAVETLREMITVFRDRDVWQHLPDWWWAFVDADQGLAEELVRLERSCEDARPDEQTAGEGNAPPASAACADGSTRE